MSRVLDTLALAEQRCAAGDSLAMDVAQARVAVGDLLDTLGPLLRSLEARITQANAMGPQACMVRQAVAAYVRAGGVK